MKAPCDGVDLANTDGRTFRELEADTVTLVNVLWLLCEEQAKTRQINERAFARRLGGDAIANAVKAVREVAVAFLPPTQRKFLERLSRKNDEMRDLAMARALERIEDPTAQAKALEALEARFDAELHGALTRLSSATPTPPISASDPTA